MSDIPSKPDQPDDGPLDGAPVQDAHVVIPHGNDTVPGRPVWCSKCKANRVPIGKGQCPVCGIWLKKNTAASKKPSVNEVRRKEILAELLVDYNPSSTYLRSVCEDLADIRERLDIVKPGPSEHERLVRESLQLFATLESSRKAPAKIDLDPLTDEELTERELLALRRLRELRGLQPLSEQETESTHTPAFDTPPIVQAPIATPLAPEPEPPVEPVPANCAFCKLPTGRCSDIKERDLITWRLLHFHDPPEIERRKQEATAVMFKQVGRPLPDWYRR